MMQAAYLHLDQFSSPLHHPFTLLLTVHTSILRLHEWMDGAQDLMDFNKLAYVPFLCRSQGVRNGHQSEKEHSLWQIMDTLTALLSQTMILLLVGPEKKQITDCLRISATKNLPVCFCACL